MPKATLDLVRKSNAMLMSGHVPRVRYSAALSQRTIADFLNKAFSLLPK